MVDLKINARKVLTSVVWIAFFVFLLIQHQVVWMHIDDYGYASLNYMVSVGTIGTEYSLMDIFRFAYVHYMEWGGRVLYYSLAIIVYRYVDLTGMRIFQSIIYFLVFFCVNRFSVKDSESRYQPVNAILTCLLYGVFTKGLAKDGLYWFSASSGYIWPVLTLLVVSYITFNLLNSNEKSWGKWCATGFLWFLASFSQEQIAVAAIVMVVCLSVYGRKNMKYMAGCILTTVIGAGIMLGAPGNWQRMGDDTSIWECIGYNVPFLFEYIFSDTMSLFMVVAFSVFSIAAVKVAKGKTQNKYIKGVLWSCATLFVVFLSLILLKPQSVSQVEKPLYYLMIFSLFAGVYITGYYLLWKDKIYAFICMIGGIMCYGAMAAVPAIPIRIALPFILLLMPTILVVLTDVMNDSRNLLISLPVAVLLLGNICEIYQGYKLNDAVHRENNSNMRSAVAAIANGETVEEITLKKVYDENYAGKMVYMQGYAIAEDWLYTYYALPESVEFKWESAYDIESVWMEKDSDGNVMWNSAGEVPCSITMSVLEGDERVYLNEQEIAVINGEEFISFQLKKENVIQGKVEVKVVSEKLGEAYTEIEIPF